MTNSRAVEVEAAGLMAQASDELLAAAAADGRLLADYARIHSRTRSGAQAKAPSLDPESSESVASAERELLAAIATLSTDRRDELVAADGSAFALRARLAGAAIVFDIEQARPGEAARPGWTIAAPLASPESMARAAREIESVAVEAPFARMRAERLGEPYDEAEHRRGAMSGAEAREAASGLLSHLWVITHVDRLLEDSFHSVHGMSQRSAHALASSAAASKAGDAVAVARKPERGAGLAR